MLPVPCALLLVGSCCSSCFTILHIQSARTFTVSPQEGWSAWHLSDSTQHPHIEHAICPSLTTLSWSDPSCKPVNYQNLDAALWHILSHNLIRCSWQKGLLCTLISLSSNDDTEEEVPIPEVAIRPAACAACPADTLPIVMACPKHSKRHHLKTA